MIRPALLCLCLLGGCYTSSMNTMVAPPIARSVPANDGNFTIYWNPRPDPIPLNQFFRVQVQVLDMWGNVVTPDDATLVVDAGMPQHGHGMNHIPRVVPQDDGTWLVEGLLMHMPGEWQLYFDIERDGVTRRAQTGLMVD